MSVEIIWLSKDQIHLIEDLCEEKIIGLDIVLVCLKSEMAQDLFKLKIKQLNDILELLRKQNEN